MSGAPDLLPPGKKDCIDLFHLERSRVVSVLEGEFAPPAGARPQAGSMDPAAVAVQTPAGERRAPPAGLVPCRARTPR